VRAPHSKVIATIGPASDPPDVLSRLIDAGVDLIRFNLSHSRGEGRDQMLATVRETVRQSGKYIGLLADLPGPKVRLGEIDEDPSEIAAGATCVIERAAVVGDASRFSLNHPEIIDDVQVGHRVFIDDGLIRLRVDEKEPDVLRCVCEVGGTIKSRKGVILPDTDTSLPALGDTDRADAIWAVRHGFDYIAMSFVRRPDDLQLLRVLLADHDADIPIVAKIETREAIERLDPIIDAADAVLVARGDLGVEIDVWRIPMLQKRMVRRCHQRGKPVIIATQMLQSMVEEAVPTRAEVSDVANAVLERADAVMLSAESAVGRHPVSAVKMLENISRQVEHDESEGGHDPAGAATGLDPDLPEADRRAAAVARSAAVVGRDLRAALLAVWCRTGRTARWVSKNNPAQQIVALCTHVGMCRRMALLRGVEPLLIESRLRGDPAPWGELEAMLSARYGLAGDETVVVVGDPVHPERVSTLSIHLVGGG